MKVSHMKNKILTKREQEIFELLINKNSTKEIAKRKEDSERMTLMKRKEMTRRKEDSQSL